MSLRLLRSGANACWQYPLLTALGAYGTLWCLGQQITVRLYGKDDEPYVFGDATELTVNAARVRLASFIGKPLESYEFGDVSRASLKKLSATCQRAIGHDTRAKAKLEIVAASFYAQARVLLQRCLDRGFLTVAEAEEGADDPSHATRAAVTAAVLLSAAVRSADDAQSKKSETIVLASGDQLVAKTSLPAALLEAFAQVLEAKRALSTNPPANADDRIELCRRVVRCALSGASNDAVSRPLLRAAAAMRERFPDYEASMDEVFVEVVEDRFGSYDDNFLSEHLLPETEDHDREDQPGRWY